MSRARLILLVLICALFAADTAEAAVTVGPSPPNPSPGTSQAVPFALPVLLFTATGPPGVTLSAPADGVITSWQFYTDDVGEAATAQLRTLTPVGPKTYTLGAAGPVEPVAPVDASGSTAHNVQHTFNSKVPISAGQFVGVEIAHAPGSFELPVLPAEEGKSWTVGCLGPGCGSEIPGDATPVVAGQFNDEWFAMNATVEPDVDHDGLGDETQDSCVGACQPAPAPGPGPSATKAKKKNARSTGSSSTAGA